MQRKMMLTLAPKVSTIIPDVATAIWDCLVFMAVPSTEEWRSIAEKFEERWNFPLCCGALDGLHVVLKAPENTGSQFFNYKGTFSLVLLAVVAAERCFRVIDVGGYGRTSDGGILANSAFGQGYLKLEPAQFYIVGLLLNCPQLHCADEVPFHLGPLPHVFVADEAFPLRKNLMRPFPGRNLPRERRIFNYRLSRARLVIENAFGILCSQWRMTTQANTQMAFSVADVEPLPGLGRIAANNSAREAIRVREVFTSYFNAEGTSLKGRKQALEEMLILREWGGRQSTGPPCQGLKKAFMHLLFIRAGSYRSLTAGTAFSQH
ncbi:hypothetical protein JOQ06_008445, partial [Pogonophryne albipinna]